MEKLFAARIPLVNTSQRIVKIIFWQLSVEMWRGDTVAHPAEEIREASPYLDRLHTESKRLFIDRPILI